MDVIPPLRGMRSLQQRGLMRWSAVAATNAVWDTPDCRRWIGLMQASYRRWQGASTFSECSPAEVYAHADVVLSHAQADDPCFVYANAAAQRIWGYSWDQFLGMPSRLSAPPELRAVRNSLLAEGLRHGVVIAKDLVRITATGRRFRVAEVTLWNVCDEHDHIVGQAATYAVAGITWLDS
jgi:PAS domain-containing protein